MVDDAKFMREALQEAESALASGEMPVGCVIVSPSGEIIARAHNEREQLDDPTAHAEIIAIRSAAAANHNWRLTGHTLYVSLEPCPMCAGAIIMARIGRVVFGAYDTQAGCAGSVYRITEDPAFNHFAPSTGGVLKREQEMLIAEFFSKSRRNSEI